MILKRDKKFYVDFESINSHSKKVNFTWHTKNNFIIKKLRRIETFFYDSVNSDI